MSGPAEPAAPGEPLALKGACRVRRPHDPAPDGLLRAVAAPPRVGLSLAGDYGSRLIVLHVTGLPTVAYGVGVVPPNPEELRAAAQEQLDRLQVPHGNVRAEHRLKQGDAVTEILRVAQEAHPVVIALLSAGRPAAALAPGSTQRRPSRQPC